MVLLYAHVITAPPSTVCMCTCTMTITKKYNEASLVPFCLMIVKIPRYQMTVLMAQCNSTGSKIWSRLQLRHMNLGKC